MVLGIYFCIDVPSALQSQLQRKQVNIPGWGSRGFLQTFFFLFDTLHGKYMSESLFLCQDALS